MVVTCETQRPGAREMASEQNDLTEAVRKLLTDSNFSFLSSLKDEWEQVVNDDTATLWQFLVKHYRPSDDICMIRKLLAEQQELKLAEKKAHLRKVLAEKKKFNARLERGVGKLVTKHAHADCQMVECCRAVGETKNKVFIMHCKTLEMERELKICDENSNLISKYAHAEENDSRNEEASLADRVSAALDHIGARAMTGRSEIVRDEDVVQRLCQEADAVGLWHAVLARLDQTCHQVEQINAEEIGQPDAGISNGSSDLVKLSHFRVQLSELCGKVASLESELQSAGHIGILKSATVKLLKNMLVVQHPGCSELLDGAVEDFVELSVCHEQLTSVRQHYLSVLNKSSEEASSTIQADVETIAKQKDDLLQKNREYQRHLNDVMAECCNLLMDVKQFICNNSHELSRYFSAVDLTASGRMAEELPALWTRELQLFKEFPLEAISGLDLRCEQSASRLLCPDTLRTCVPVHFFTENVTSLYNEVLLLPPESSVTKLANMMAFKVACDKRKQSAKKLAVMPKVSVDELKMMEDNVLSTTSEKLAHIHQSLAALMDSFQENEANLLFWTSQPLSSAVKTMVVKGKTFEEFQQERNRSQLSRSRSIHSDLNKLTSRSGASCSIRKRTDSV